MTFRSIDPGRLSFLLKLGTQEGELKRFFKETQKQLILKGAKIQNLPHGGAAQVAAIAGKLPTSTDAVVSDWFYRNVTMVDPLPVSEIVSEFELYEIANDVLPQDHAIKLARSCLTHLFAPDPPTELLAFLGTRIGMAPDPQPIDQSTPATTEALITQLPDLPDSTNKGVFLELLAALIEEEPAEDLLDQFPNDLATYIAALIDVRRGDLETAEMVLSAMPMGSQERLLLSRSVKRATARGAQQKIAAGIQLVGADDGAEDFDSHSEAILAYCKNNEKPTATFVQPMAVLRNMRVQFFTSAQRIEAFPGSGDVIAFSGSAYPRQPKRGEIGFWRVAEHGTDKKTRFHLDAEIASVYEITKVPFHGTDPDSVRGYIKHTWDVRRSASLQLQLYELADGLVIAPRNERADLSRDDSYEQPFNSWNHVSAVLFEGRTLVVGPLPAPTGAYECAPLAYAAKQLTKAAIDQGAMLLTNSQKRELSNVFASLDVGLDKQRVRRVTAELDRVIADEAALQDVVSLLLNHPQVDKRIADGVEAVVRSRTLSKDQLLSEIERLKKEKTAWDLKLKDASEKSRKQASETASIVKAAFDKAISAGTEALANASIVKALNGEQGIQGQLIDRARPTSCGFVVTNLEPLTWQEAVGLLASCGVNRRFAEGVLGAANIAVKCGLTICLKGAFARHAARVIAAGIAEIATAISVGIGLVESEPFWGAVSINKSTEVVALLDANLSAIDLYGGALIDHLLRQACDPSRENGPAFVLALSDSVMSLPLPKSLKRLSLTIDLDGHPDFSTSANSNKLQSLLARGDTTLPFPVELVLERVREQVDELDPTVRDLVSTVLAAALDEQ